MKELKHEMILSASGWRKIFAESKNEQDKTSKIGNENKLISVLSALLFADFIKKRAQKQNPTIIVGMDTRPTGNEIANEILKALLVKNCNPRFVGITAAPEIMAFSKAADGFIYISASHNPIGHNGIKFGLNDGGVLCAKDNSIITQKFYQKCTDEKFLTFMQNIVDLDFSNKILFEEILKEENSYANADNNFEKNLTSNLDKNLIKEKLNALYEDSKNVKNEALKSYYDFSKTVISALDSQKEKSAQDNFFEKLKNSTKQNKIKIVCDMNGSARTLSIDEKIFHDNNIEFFAFNNKPGQITHEIIPEPENLIYCANKMQELQAAGDKNAILGYMPDCDGDRGNLVYWDEKEKIAKPLKAQEVFSLSVLAELSFCYWQNLQTAESDTSKNEKNVGDKNNSNQKLAIAVNCPTSMRINEIARAFDAKVFRAEVGEANVVNLAREKRTEGFNVRILGEGSNGGTITNPASVRDPINTVFAFIKLLTIKDEILPNGKIQKGLFHIWLDLSNQSEKYKNDFTLSDIISTLPIYTTTGVSETRAILKILTKDHAELKRKFQKLFEESFKNDLSNCVKKYNISSYKCVITNGTKETFDVTDFSKSEKGGLKILFFEKSPKTGLEEKEPSSFIWMRGSGTEPVFRIMCDVKGSDFQKEKDLLQWETNLLLEADK